jgi:hypothetical protein
MPKTPVISIVDDDETVRDGTLDLLKSMSRGLQAGLICEIMNDDTMERVPHPIHPHR